MTDRKKFGAYITYKWSGDDEDLDGYVSFGEYDGNLEISVPDGTPDEYIFYYCSEQELLDMIGVEQPDGWTILKVGNYNFGTDDWAVLS